MGARSCRRTFRMKDAPREELLLGERDVELKGVGELAAVVYREAAQIDFLLHRCKTDRFDRKPGHIF